MYGESALLHHILLFIITRLLTFGINVMTIIPILKKSTIY